MRPYLYSIFYLGYDDKGYIELLCDDLKEEKFEFHHLSADINDLPTQVSFLQGPVYIIADLDTIQNYGAVIKFLNEKFTIPVTIGVGRMFDMGPLLRASACGLDHFVDKTRSKQIILKNIKKYLPIEESSIETEQKTNTINTSTRYNGQFLADESEIMQDFLSCIHRNKDAKYWIIVGCFGAEFELANSEIVSIIGKTTNDMFYPEFQGEQCLNDSVLCYSPANPYDLSRQPSQYTIRSIHATEFEAEKHIHEDWIVMYLPDLLVRPSDKVQYFNRWIHKIEQMNKGPGFRSLSDHQIHELLCNDSIISFKDLWYWMEQQVLTANTENAKPYPHTVTDEHSLCIVQTIRQNYVKLVESTIPEECLDEILEELKFTENH